jgi:hypothetical protein
MLDSSPAGHATNVDNFDVISRRLPLMVMIVRLPISDFVTWNMQTAFR